MRLIKYFLIFLVFSFISGVNLQYCNTDSFITKEKADSFYKYKEYNKALDYYIKLLENEESDEIIQNVKLKIALCYFNTKDYEKSLKYLKKNNLPVADYVDYFSLLCYKNLNDSESLIKTLNFFLNEHRNSLLIDDVSILHAEFLNENGQFLNSNNILLELSKKINEKKKLQTILTIISDNYYKLKEYENSIKYYKKIIDDYPFEPISAGALEKIIEIRKIEGKTLSDEEILNGISLYISKREYRKAYEFFKIYSQKIVNKNIEKEFEEGRIFYYLRKYDAAVEIFKEFMSKYPDSDFNSNALLFIARSYFRKGDIENSIREYIRFTKLFPKKSIFPEVIWKLGWIFEGKRDFNNAIKYYRINAKKRNEFSLRSQWRAGFCYYKMKKYNEAINAFNIIIRKKNIRERLRDNAIYWKAKSYEKLDDIKNSKSILKILVSAEFPNYYTFKAEEKLNSKVILNNINIKYNENISKIDADKYPEIKKGEIVGDIFGKNYGVQILDDSRKKRKNTLEFLENLSIAYEDIGATSKAIRVSIAIKGLYNRGEISYDYESLLRKVYPNYFKEEILKTVKDNEIEPAVILSIMRRESAFESDAISRAGAVGLLQLLPENGSKVSKRIGRKFAWEDLIVPEINILLGYEHFKSLLKKYNGNYAIAFASYNAGEYNVDKWIKRYGIEDIDEFIESLEYIETRDYVKAVLEAWWIYKRLYG